MTTAPIPAGDAALLLELEPRIDAEVNARAIGIANEVRRRTIPGVRDVISTYRSVAVHFDPLKTDVRAVSNALQGAWATGASAGSGRKIEIPVVYGGAAGPDLASVASFAGMSEADVIRRHSERPYRVFMLGFVPGFAYMGVVDPRIAAPRHATPRLKVAEGSVGIAGSQTGIYPREAPGGWQIIGRTDVSLFADERGESPLLWPGDIVTFAPDPANLKGSRSRMTEWLDRTTRSPTMTTPTGEPLRFAPADHGARAVTVVAPGLFTSVQNLGRWGRQHEGVPVGGAMDTLAHRAANRCLGNPDTAAALEVTILGPEIRMDCPATVAIAGADLDATIDGSSVALQTPTPVRAGATLRFGGRRSGARAYVAFDGGVDAPVRYGRRLRAGDRLPLGDAATGAPVITAPPLPRSGGVPRLRVMPGPQRAFFDERGLETLTRTTFTVSPDSNRMAYRLKSMRPITRATEQEMISDAAFTGGVQVTPAGDVILLMADRQTTGGYPQIATVITADLPAAGQLAPGDEFTFEWCTSREAMAALEAQEGLLRVHR